MQSFRPLLLDHTCHSAASGSNTRLSAFRPIVRPSTSSHARRYTSLFCAAKLPLAGYLAALDKMRVKPAAAAAFDDAAAVA